MKPARRIVRPAWGVFLAMGLLSCGVVSEVKAADHGDGQLGFDVTQSLLEGPVYPTAPLEVDLTLRVPPDPVLPSGQMQILLISAQSGAGEDLAVLGSAFDNGDPFGEPGDDVIVDIRAHELASPHDYPSDAAFEGVVFFGDDANVTEWQIHHWRPSRAGREVSYFTVELMAVGPGGEELGAVQLLIELRVGPGQDLVIANPSITAPVTSGPETELRIFFEVNQDGGDVDPAETAFTLKVTTGTFIPVVPSPYGVLLIVVSLLGGGAIASGMRGPSRAQIR